MSTTNDPPRNPGLSYTQHPNVEKLFVAGRDSPQLHTENDKSNAYLG